MSTALDAIKSARVYLNDSNNTLWNDAVLMPILTEAFGELQLELGIHRNPVIKAETAPTLIVAGITLFPTPTTITSPIAMFERYPGDDNDDWEEMIQVTFLPETDPGDDLTFWSWTAQQIQFVGALNDKQVKLRYNGYLQSPVTLNDTLGFIWAERFLGPRVASIALSSIGQEKRAAYANEIAQKNLYEIMQYNVTEDQRPVRRRKFRSAKNSSVPGSTPVGLP